MTAETWIVVADGASARIFEERRRLGPLSECTDLAMAADGKMHGPSDQDAAGANRTGAARHASATVESAAKAERRFISRLAASLDAAVLAKSFRNLVLIAPPEALGQLRDALRPAAARCIEACDPHERRTEDARALRTRLQQLRSQD